MKKNTQSVFVGEAKTSRETSENSPRDDEKREVWIGQMEVKRETKQPPDSRSSRNKQKSHVKEMLRN